MKSKKGVIVKLIISAVIILLFALLLKPELLFFLPDGTTEGVREFTGKYFSNADGYGLNGRSILAFIITIAVTVSVANIVKWLFTLGKGGSNHSKTVKAIAGSLVKYVIYIAGLAVALNCFGVSLAASFAGVGVLALVVGLGAESLIEDIITGFFIVFENEFEVGDIITIDDFRGEVKSIGLRTISVLDPGGNVRIFNNSELGSIVNLSRETSACAVTIPISYIDKLEDCEGAVKEAIAKVAEKEKDLFITNPVYLGVDSLEPEYIELLVRADVKEENIFIAKRAINREFRIAAEKAGLSIPKIGD